MIMVLEDLADLRRHLADTDVLSVYIDAAENDPTERSSWRMRLAAHLDAVEQNLDEALHGPFAAARHRLDAALRTYRGFLPGRGWAAFVTADQVWDIGEVPAPMPDLVRWRRGPVLGPYLRALKQNRPVVLALVDQRRARLLRYQNGTLTEYADHRADGFIDDLTDRTMSKRGGVYSGMRGETGTDAAERMLREETDRLIKQVTRDLKPADGDAFIILAGSTPAVAALHRLLEPATGERLTIESGMHLTMSVAELQPRVETAASALTRRRQFGDAVSITDDAGPGGSALLGRESVAAATALGQVERVLVTPALLQEHEEQAEMLIGQTLEHGGEVELASDEAAALLDDVGGGVGARLRYAVRAAPVP
jgi:hypothetical protein